jgi:hypothetical protein
LQATPKSGSCDAAVHGHGRDVRGGRRRGCRQLRDRDPVMLFLAGMGAMFGATAVEVAGNSEIGIL